MMLQTPLGFFGGLLVPLNHWGPLLATVTPAASPAEILNRAALYLFICVLLPLAIGIGALRFAAKRGAEIA
jgi:hypothetical protein